ncbi:MAG: hypothetical protein WB755_01065, partial [Terriglobales bacterium]
QRTRSKKGLSYFFAQAPSVFPQSASVKLPVQQGIRGFSVLSTDLQPALPGQLADSPDRPLTKIS